MTKEALISPEGEEALLKLAALTPKLPDLPQHRVPKGMEVGSEEHVLFLLTLCFLTPRTVGSQVADGLEKLYLQGVQVKDLAREALETRSIAIIHSKVDAFYRCLNQIEAFGDMDDFCRIETVDKFIEWKKTFRFDQVGPKVYSLFRMTLDEMGVYDCPYDSFPVDSHASNFFFQLGEVNFTLKEGTAASVCVKKVEDHIRPKAAWFLEKHKIKPWRLHNAIYYIGSTHCGECHKFSKARVCSIHSECPGRAVSKRYQSGLVHRDPVFADKITELI